MRRICFLIAIAGFISGCKNIDRYPRLSDKDIMPPVTTLIDPYTFKKINSVLSKCPKPHFCSIDALSAEFLATPYQGNLLKGSVKKPEELVIDLRGLDCFTYLDYVEAFRRSSKYSDFINNVLRTRYVRGHLHFTERKHFFTDWAEREFRLADDITRKISSQAITTEKYLNQKKDGGSWVQGVPVVKRNVSYIPAKQINPAMLDQLQSGDLIGIYTHLQGLDVTHVGFFIRNAGGPVFRNASS